MPHTGNHGRTSTAAGVPVAMQACDEALWPLPEAVRQARCAAVDEAVRALLDRAAGLH